MLGFLWSAANDQLDSTRAERDGIVYLSPVFELIQTAQERRSAAIDNTPELAGLQDKVEGAFSKLLTQQQALGTSLNTQQGFDEVRKLHAALKQTPTAQTPDATFTAHSDYIAALLKLVADAADGSQLSLDPELDTYHMMLVSIIRGPQQTENTARLRGFGELILRTKDNSQSRRDRMTEWMAVQPFLDADVERSYKQGIEGFPEVAKTFDMAGTDAAFDAFMNAVKQQVMGGELKGSAADYLALGNAIVAKQNALNAQILKRLDARLQERIETLRNRLWLELTLAILFVALAAYLMLAFFKVMMGGLQEVAGHLRAITKGNLTTAPRPWGTDEAAQLMLTMGEMQTALRHIVGVVLEGSSQVQTASGEIAAAALDLSQRTEQAAANLEETAASMEQISGQVKHAASTVEGARTIVQGNARAATDCGIVIGDVVQTMERIRVSSNKIGEIIGVIDGIAFQTNILALNAAVEAARAGEHGRGFAVVASEVRALAGRSATAAKEIKTLISSSIEQVESGNAVVANAGELMGAIVGNAGQIAQLMQDIAEGTQQQGRGVVEVGAAVRTLDQATQQNAALVEQTSAAASGLADQARRLHDEASFFKLA